MVKKIAFVSLCLFVSVGMTQHTHTVRKGDTLWDLSGEYLDNPFDWPLIYKANVGQIDDPHWIFPGQEFLIPGHAAAAHRMGEPAPRHDDYQRRPMEFETAVEHHEGDEARVQADVVVAKPEPLEVEHWQRQGYVVSPALVYRAGYITHDLPEWGAIVDVDGTGHRQILTHHEVLVNRGARDIVAPEDFFTVIRIGRGVKNPRTGEELGRIIHVLGTLSASSVEEESFRGLVETAYEPMRVGDLVVPYMELETPPARELADATRQLEGTIVAELTKDDRLMTSDIVFIDKGEVDGIHPGDVFKIYREGRTRGGVLEPERTVGELQVLGVREVTSSAVINSIDNSLDLRIGELIKLTKEAM